MQQIETNHEQKRKPRSRSAWIVSRASPLIAFALRVTVHLFALCPLPLNHFYGHCIGLVLWWTDSETRRVSRKNLELAYPDRSANEIDAMLKANLIELGKTITEMGPVWTGSRKRLERLIVEIRGHEHLDAARATGRGVIILSPHVGSWEIVGQYLAFRYKITSLYRPPRLTAAEAFTRQVRERFGATLVPTDLAGVSALRRALKRNEMIGILPDQDPGESGGIHAPFFGQSARTMLLVSKLAMRTNCPVLFTVGERLSWGRGFRLHVIPASANISSTDNFTAARALNEGVEACIHINPSQYQWSYKRFKSQPDGQVSPYRELRRAA